MSFRSEAVEAMRRAGSGRHSRTTADAAAKLDALVAFLVANSERWFEEYQKDGAFEWPSIPELERAIGALR